MKRNMDLIREILFFVEERHSGGFEQLQIRIGYEAEPFLPAYDLPTLIYHLELLHDAGLIKRVPGDEEILGLMELEGLTWEGHEFLDSIRDDAVWQKTRSVVTQAGVGTLGAIKDIAVQISVNLATKLLGI